MTHIVHKELSYLISGILFTVHNEIGPYSSEGEICDRIEWYLSQKKIPYKREMILPASHEGERPGRHRVGFLVDNKLVLEIKSKRSLARQDFEQVRRYLIKLNLALGILVNFRDRRLKPERVLNGSGKE